MTEHLTSEEIEKAQVGSDLVALKAARRKLEDDVAKLASERLGLEREVRGMLPTKFVEAYLGLMDKALGLRQDYRLNPDHGLGVKDGGRGFGSGDGGLRDDAAAGYRRNVDRQLRAMARKMTGWMSADRKERLALSVPVRCGRCSKFCDQDWKYCAWCGEGLRSGSQE